MTEDLNFLQLSQGPTHWPLDAFNETLQIGNLS